jgi:hypothetical protein
LNFLAVFLEERVSESFAGMLQKARRNCRDPVRGGLVTQERFVELLSEQIAHARAPTAATLSNWERGRSQPNSHDRAMLCAIVAVLLDCGGLARLAEANVLLTRGGYAPLTQPEAQRCQRELPQRATVAERSSRHAIPLRKAQVFAEPTPSVDAHATQRNGQEAHPPAHFVQVTTLIALRHQSTEQMSTTALRSALEAALQACEYIEITIE